MVEIVLVDQGNFRNAHAMHIHGYRFQVVAQDTLGEETTLEEVKRLDRAGIHQSHIRLDQIQLYKIKSWKFHDVVSQSLYLYTKTSKIPKH